MGPGSLLLNPLGGGPPPFCHLRPGAWLGGGGPGRLSPSPGQRPVPAPAPPGARGAPRLLWRGPVRAAPAGREGPPPPARPPAAGAARLLCGRACGRGEGAAGLAGKSAAPQPLARWPRAAGGPSPAASAALPPETGSAAAAASGERPQAARGRGLGRKPAAAAAAGRGRVQRGCPKAAGPLPPARPSLLPPLVPLVPCAHLEGASVRGGLSRGLLEAGFRPACLPAGLPGRSPGAKMLPGKAEKRRSSSLFIPLAPPGRAPVAPDKVRAPQSCSPPGQYRPIEAPEAAGAQPPRTCASAAKGVEGGSWGVLGMTRAGGSTPPPPSFLPSCRGRPAPEGVCPPPPLSSDPFLAPALQEERGALRPPPRQISSMFPAELRQMPILSPKFDWASETGKPVEKAISTDICAFCHKALCSWAPAVQAMNKQYHAECFRCRVCHSALAGQQYFQREGRPLCTACYQSTLEKCAKCQASIWSQIVRALGSGYHPECFVCVECGRTIGDETFVVDEEGGVHCLGDFHRKFAWVCSACEKAITPSGGRDRYRIECLGRCFHEDCYRCQSCRVRLSPESTEDGCYPLNGCLFCKACHVQHKESSR
uniref:filamin-binding LIM protein 1 n=1 Tax=Euleptes europaea TaxID=460621 RepID=UPI00253FD3F9|nr:filamin-binding LIM protein 1 [Euleptes europaea]